MTLNRPPWDSTPPPTPRCAQCGRVLDLKHGSNVDEQNTSLCAHCGDLTRVEQILGITPDTLSDATHDLACEREARTLAWASAKRRVKDYRYSLRHSTYDTAIAGLLDALDEMERLEETGV